MSLTVKMILNITAKEYVSFKYLCSFKAGGQIQFLAPAR